MNRPVSYFIMCLNNCVLSTKVNHDKELVLQDMHANVDDLLNRCNYIDLDNLHTIKNSTGSLNIIQWNARSLYNKITNLKSILNNLENARHFTDIILISETHLDSVKVKYVDINGYNFYCDSRKTMKGGGTGIYIRNNIKCSKRTDLSIFLEHRFETTVL